MKVRRVGSVGVAALSYSMVLLLAGRFAGSNACCWGMYRGDGDCDDCNNAEECDYDGGDCCKESCVDGEFVCGEHGGYNCLDPDYKDDDDYPQQSSYSYDDYWCRTSLEGNGNCDSVNNSEECGYDGGDCCEESCVDNDYTCGDYASYNCLDPAYHGDDDPQESSSHSYAFWCDHKRIGNAYCDDRNNDPECGYDGGDCCEESCVDSVYYMCADNGIFYCIDPDYSEEEYPFHLCNPDLIGNGSCDGQNNKPECGYDNGDCCEESCVDSVYMCADNGIFYCVDPDYSEEEYPFHLCNPDLIGNGSCDGQNNKPECGYYDAGDCCEETCVDDVYMCADNGIFYCLDPVYYVP